MRLNSPLISDAGVTGFEPCSDAESASAGSLNDYIPHSNKEGSLLADNDTPNGESKNSQFLHFLKSTIVTSSQKVYKSGIAMRKKQVALHALRFGNEYRTYWGRSVIGANAVCKNML